MAYSLFALMTLAVPLARGPFGVAFTFLLLAQFGGDLFATIAQISAVTVEQQVTPDHWLGRVRGTFQAFSGGLEVLGALIAGPVALTWSVRGAFWVATLGLVFSTLLLVGHQFRRYPTDSGKDALSVEGFLSS